MRYRATVGNPPYNVNNSEISTSATVIYPHFFLALNSISEYSSLITPARWFNSPKPEVRTARAAMMEQGIDFVLLEYNTEQVFVDAEIKGGLSWYLHKYGNQDETSFQTNGKPSRIGKMFDPSGMISVNEIGEIREVLRSGPTEHRPYPTLSWIFPALRDTKLVGNEVYRERSHPTRQNPDDVRMRITTDEWRYFPKEILDPGYYIPDGGFGLCLSTYSSNHATSLNDRTLILHGLESAKRSVVLPCADLAECVNLYKYLRTKFAMTLISGRMGSFDSMSHVYKDLPQLPLDDSGPIDWSKTIPEIDERLIAQFGLEDYREFIMSQYKPFARAFGLEQLQELAASGIDVRNLNGWYDS